MQNFDSIVAGAGIWGCTVARRLAEAGRKVLVLEKRRAIGGNCRCRTIDGIEVHLYGSHIFHTSNEEVWTFVNRFVSFNDYRHSVLACTAARPQNAPRTTRHEPRTYHLPIGKTLLQEFFGVDMHDKNVQDFLSQTSQTSQTLYTHGSAVFDAFIRGYTSKQWGVPPEKVDPSIIARLKVRDSYSTDYFDDPYQGIPVEGYNELFRRMLDHPNITVRCNHSVKVEKRGGGGERIVIVDEVNKTRHPISTSNINLYYSGPLDALFNYKYGALPWRSLRFETEHLAKRDFQGATVVNYTDADVPYTRIHEFKHYHPEPNGPFSKPRGTIITREYPADWEKGDEPYYPINTPESAALLAKYQEDVVRLNEQLKQPDNSNNQTILTVGGRLGGYKYYDMDKAIEAALKVKNCVAPPPSAS